MHRVAVFALALAACSPSPTPAPEQGVRVMTGEAAQTEAALTWAAVADDPQAIGQWSANADETRAEFASDAGPVLTFGCERGFLQFERFFSRPHGFAPGDGGPPFNILSPRERIAYFATPALDNPQRIYLAAPRADFRLDDFVASEDGFAIQTAGEITRFPHDPMLARVLANCRAVDPLNQ
jgi:hypothetical protein